MTHATIKIKGMFCFLCSRRIRRAFGGVPGLVVHEVSVGKAVVDFDPTLVSVDKIKEVVAEAGYDVSSIEAEA